MKTTFKTLEQLEQVPDRGSYPVDKLPGVDKQIQARNVSDGMVSDYDGHCVNPNYPRAYAWGLERSSVACKIRSLWLVRNGLMELVCEMMELSVVYDFPWAASWENHLGNPDWLGKAMARTFERISPKDQDCIRPMYDDWLWFEKNIDMQALVTPEFNALCYLLDGKGKRIIRPEGPVTVLRGLKGQDKQQALATLDRRYYEFKAWW
jgi:hypothetical protein